MSELVNMLRAQTEAINSAYKAGHHTGYQEGFAAGIAEAQRIIHNTFGKKSEQPPKEVAA